MPTPTPTDRLYTDSHEWHKVEGDTVTLGLTAYAVDQLTDVTYVQMKPAGTRFRAGEVVGEVESVKTTSDVYAAIAGEITQIHCQATGAPAAFVHVVFVELPPGSAYSAGRPSPTCVINARIRSGRSLEVRQGIVTDLAEMWERITGLAEHKLIVALEEVEANTLMEDGLILPNPGEEADWLERNRNTRVDTAPGTVRS